jgi:hypothetical protein
MGKRAVLTTDRCAYRFQLSVAFLQNKVNHFSILWGRPTSGCCSGDTFGEKNMWNNLASAYIKKMKGIKHKILEEALTIWIGQLNVKNGTATDDIIKERAKMICT